MNIQHDMLAAARKHINDGESLVTVYPGTKKPRTWKHRQETRATLDEIVDDLTGGFNIARVNGMISQRAVFDFDDIDFAEEFAGRYPHLCRVISLTRRGIHIHFRTSKPVKSRHFKDFDLLAEGSLTLLPPSIVEDHEYRWIEDYEPSNGYPEFPYHLLPEQPVQNVPQMPVVTCSDRQRRIWRAEKYLAVMEPAVSGKGGHNQLFKAACVCTQKFGLTREEALPLLLNYNDRCEPPFTEKGVIHKLDDALKSRP